MNKKVVLKSLEDIYLEDIRDMVPNKETEVYPLDDMHGFETGDDSLDTYEEFPISEPEVVNNGINLRPDGEEIVNQHLSQIATELVDNGLCDPEEAEMLAQEAYDTFVKILKIKRG